MLCSSRTDRQTHTKVNTEDTLSWFPELFLQPNIKDRSNNNVMKVLFCIYFSPQSSSSLPGFNNLKSVMMKHVASFQQDEEMRASKAQQLQHINSWIESVGRYAMEIQPDLDVPLCDSLPDNKDYNFSSVATTTTTTTNNNGNSNYHDITHNQGAGGDQHADLQYNHQPRFEENIMPVQVVGAFKEPSRGGGSVSPKPICSTQPNVIKPQAVLHVSPSMSSPPPSAPNLQMVQPANPVVSRREEIDDNFGFEPPYETLSKHAPSDRISSPLREEGDGNYVYPSSSNTSNSAYPMSPESESVHKKKENAKFFKSFLKRDPKRSNQEDGNQPSYSISTNLHKGGSTPFNKLRNTFVQKLSGSSSGLKKTASDAPVMLVPSHQDVPPKPPKGFIPAESESRHDEGNKPTNHNYEEKKGNYVEYQNYYYPGHPRRDVVTSANKQTEHDGKKSHMLSNIKDGHDSLPSTISSVNSYQDNAAVKNYSMNIRVGDANISDRNPVQKGSSYNQKCSVNDMNNNVDGNKSSKTSKARQRAAIALGSNMSISEVYGKATEAAHAEGQRVNVVVEDEAEASAAQEAEGGVQGDPTSSSNVWTNSPEPKWVKANAVPVYKAKIIPNYENQMKLSPYLERGVRGQAEAPQQPPSHDPHTANSSDVYRQELQRKSEQFIGGGMYPTLSQVKGKPSYIPGMPTSYTVLPPKPINYHASPIIVSNSAHAGSSSSVDTTGFTKAGHSVLRHSNSHGEHDGNKNNPHFVVSPDGRLQMEPAAKMPKSDERHQDVPVSSYRRSASAHSVLDKDRDDRRGMDNMQISPYNSSEGRRSRKDNAQVKITPTSHATRNSHSKVVGNLADRFDKPVSNPMAIGLLDIDDKPPSMTSTPVARRKNTVTSGSGDAQNPGQRHPEEEGRSRSNGNFSSPHSGQPSDKHRQYDQQHAQNPHQSKSQTVAPFLVKSSPQHHPSQNSHNYNNIDGGFNSPQARHKTHPQTSRSQDLAVQSSGNPQDHIINAGNLEHAGRHSRDPLMKHSGQNNYGETHIQSPVSSNFSVTPRDRPHHSDHHSRSSSSKRSPHTPSSQNQSHTPSSIGQGQSSSQGGQNTPSSLNHRQSKASLLASPLATSSASSQISNYQSPFLPKPEAQYPTLEEVQQTFERDQQVAYPHQQSFQPDPQQHSSHNHNQHPTQHSAHANYSSQQLPHNSQLYNSPNHYNNSNNNQFSSPSAGSNEKHFQKSPSNNYESYKYSEELRRASKSTNSAFERPLKNNSLPYSRQPGAMAVVKPTVMHL